MCCSDSVPGSWVIEDTGWIDYNPANSALLQDYGLKTSNATIPNMFAANSTHSTLLELHIEETNADGADMKRAALRLNIFNQSTTAPSVSAAYDPDLSKRLGTVLIPSGVATPSAGGYTRLSAKKAVCVLYPNLTMKSTIEPGTDGMFNLLADQSVQYVSGATIRVRFVFRHHVC
jgi:hypothetical protein